MKYEKPALTFDEQADLLIRRGLISDREKLIGRLKSVSYYRLSGYWYPFRRPDDTFVEGSTLDETWRRYTFDRLFRLVMLDAIERVEVCVRTELVYLLAHAQGPFGYVDPASLPGMSPYKHAEFLQQLDKECGRSQEEFIDHFRKKYGAEHSYPPYWMVTELMTLGALLTLFRGSPSSVRKQIAGRFGTTDKVFDSWLGALTAVRNICAHHGRLWNRVLGYKPMIPKKAAQWHEPVEVSNTRVFGVLTILKYLLSDITRDTQWPTRLSGLLAEYPEIPLDSMGFPEDWRLCPLWVERD